jgi:hypothetical protein
MEEILFKITGEDGLSPILARNAGELGVLETRARNMGTAMDRAIQSNIKTTNQARTAVENFNAKTQLGTQQITGGLTPAMQGIDTRKLEQLGVHTTKTTTHMGRLKESIGKVNNVLNGMGGILTGLIGIGIVAWLKQTIDKARTAHDEWAKLNAILKEHGINLETAKTELSKTANTYGFAVSEVREATRIFITAGMSYQDVTQKQGALNAAMALSVTNGKDVAESARDLQRAYQGNGRALKLLGINIKDYKDATTGAIDVQKLNTAIMEHASSQLEAHSKSGEASITRYHNAINKLQVVIGEKLLPVLTPLIEMTTKVVTAFTQAPTPIQYLTLGFIGLISITALLSAAWSLIGKNIIMGLIPNLTKLITTIRGVATAETLLAITTSSAFLPIVILTGAIIALGYAFYMSGQRARNYYEVLEHGDEKIAKAKTSVDYYTQRVKELTDERDRLKRAGKDSTEVEKKLTEAKEAGIRANEDLARTEEIVRQVRDKHAEVTEKKADAERKFDEAVKQRLISQGKTPEQADSIIYDLNITEEEKNFNKYNESLGSLQERMEKLDITDTEQYAKHAKKLAKAQYDLENSWENRDIMGIITSGISINEEKYALGNIEYIKQLNENREALKKWWNDTVKYYQDIPNKIQNALKNLQHDIAQPFKDAWTNAKNWVQKKGDEINKYVKKLPGKISQSLTHLWHDITQPFKDAWNHAKNYTQQKIDDIVSAIKHLPDRILDPLNRFCDMVKDKANEAMKPLKDLMDIIYGHSPGVIPAFKDLSNQVHINMEKILPHIAKLDNALHIPQINTPIPPLKIPTNYLSPNISSIPLSNYNTNTHSFTNNNHIHHHSPITINAKDMTKTEFRSILIEILEGTIQTHNIPKK